MDWLAGIFELSGLWIYVSITQGIYGLLLVVVPALFINIRNFFKWKTNE